MNGSAMSVGDKAYVVYSYTEGGGSAVSVGHGWMGGSIHLSSINKSMIAPAQLDRRIPCSYTAFADVTL